jgi:hypothetical protein
MQGRLNINEGLDKGEKTRKQEGRNDTDEWERAEKESACFDWNVCRAE